MAAAVTTGWVVAQRDGDHTVYIRWDDGRLTVAHLDRRVARLRIVTRPPVDLFERRDQENHRQELPAPTVRVVSGWPAIDAELDDTTTLNL
jgi:hypothetical protein